METVQINILFPDMEHVTSFSTIDLTSRYYEFVWEDMGKTCPAGVYYAVKKQKIPRLYGYH